MAKRVLLIAALAVATSAQAANADYYLKIDGISREAPAGPIYLSVTSTGDLDGDGLPDEGVLRINCAAGKLASSQFYVSKPRDAASGQASGKRQHAAVTFVKEWGAATPQLMRVNPGYNVKEAKGARVAAGADGWTSVELTDADGLCPAAETAVKATKSRSNIQNN